MAMSIGLTEALRNKIASKAKKGRGIIGEEEEMDEEEEEEMPQTRAELEEMMRTMMEAMMKEMMGGRM